MDSSSSSSSSPDEEEEDLPLSHPARILDCGSKNEKNLGWGEAMELAHEREREKNNGATQQPVAVDLNQFRNTEVGKGYQAKHVVRQRTATATKTKITTINSNVDRRNHNGPATATTTIKKEELLRNDGLRAFRREIENILSP